MRDDPLIGEESQDWSSRGLTGIPSIPFRDGIMSLLQLPDDGQAAECLELLSITADDDSRNNVLPIPLQRQTACRVRVPVESTYTFHRVSIRQRRDKQGNLCHWRLRSRIQDKA